MSAELATPAAKAAKDEANSSKIVPVDLPYGDKARWLFRTTFVQVSIACVILFNFGAIVVEKEIDPCSDASMQKMPELWAALFKPSPGHSPPHPTLLSIQCLTFYPKPSLPVQ